MTEEKTIHLLPGLLRIPDPDAPVYRIFGLWFFEATLRQRDLVLVPPRRWEDPYEVLAEWVMMIDPRRTPYKQQSLRPFLRPAYAQCWSRTDESDTLLRAYSHVIKDSHFDRNTCPRDEGVRVRSTARKLLTAMQKWSTTVTGTSCFVGAVRYGSDKTIHQHVANLVQQHGPPALGRGEHRAELLLLKRRAFAHEAEVRLICIDERDIPEQDALHIPIDPSEVFEEVTFDPRLAIFERKEREAVARNLGYAGQFKESDLYQGTSLQIFLPNGWQDG